MGFYINPKNCSKEQFLAEKGERIQPHEAKQVFDGGTHLPVCFVDNGIFTAVTIGYSKNEIDEIDEIDAPRDGRPKEWYSVRREDLAEFYPDALVDLKEIVPAGSGAAYAIACETSFDDTESGMKLAEGKILQEFSSHGKAAYAFEALNELKSNEIVGLSIIALTQATAFVLLQEVDGNYFLIDG